MLKKEDIERFATIEENKMEDPYSIKKYVTALEGLPDLQIEEMIKPADMDVWCVYSPKVCRNEKWLERGKQAAASRE
jgi:hypothetical protein